MKNIKTYLLYVILFISMMTNFILVIKVKNQNGDTFLVEETTIIQDYTQEPDTLTQDYTQEPDTLSNWDIFTLALIKVESEYNNSAVSSVGAKGYFQMTPIYVKEVNRVHNTNFTFNQVTDFDKAYEIFNLMQKAHNPDYNMDRALELHNGKHEWYNKRVYKEMKNIMIYEDMRNKIKNIKQQ